ncbi:MAG TPA: hypothetical protein VGK23_00380 [Methanomassiliicoccales archaeon]|jgi:hypothetical protein
MNTANDAESGLGAIAAMADPPMPSQKAIWEWLPSEMSAPASRPLPFYAATGSRQPDNLGILEGLGCQIL